MLAKPSCEKKFEENKNERISKNKNNKGIVKVRIN